MQAGEQLRRLRVVGSLLDGTPESMIEGIPRVDVRLPAQLPAQLKLNAFRIDVEEKLSPRHLDKSYDLPSRAATPCVPDEHIFRPGMPCIGC